ncbi:predicted protein [Sclerotinia sclerotiorum 1980 UF-70]|uniref:Uncharacterized protein n=1 Tax=Sclerotinia sclerotiorum (strain ATCC 18683 / 1980 / Ss-1) TaxID=665079 RepID=A7EVY7_SCLS1|nr:predicted protein [Sclerotinia sclerotiorum 1980 UF-70]EDN93629.1 predicted protein [Sclerotinia sclerotiorum 1980 UF-70]
MAKVRRHFNTICICARQTPAPPPTSALSPIPTTKTTLDASQSASQSLAIQSALASYASSLSAASTSDIAAGSTGSTLAGPGASAAAKPASGSGADTSVMWINVGLGLVVSGIGLL